MDDEAETNLLYFVRQVRSGYRRPFTVVVRRHFRRLFSRGVVVITCTVAESAPQLLLETPCRPNCIVVIFGPPVTIFRHRTLMRTSYAPKNPGHTYQEADM